MRILVTTAFCLVASAASAQTVLKLEPLVLNPGAVVLVDNGSCTTGRLLKVTGARHGLMRKRKCVDRVDQQAALAE